MTTNDWFELMEADAGALRQLKWDIDPYSRIIRTLKDECPVCAWCRVKGARDWKLAYPIALRDVFGDTLDPSTIEPLVWAADGLDNDIRARLVALLGLKEPKEPGHG